MWTLRDRFSLLEQALGERGIPSSELIEEASRRPERASAMERDRDAFLQRFLSALDDDEKDAPGLGE